MWSITTIFILSHQVDPVQSALKHLLRSLEVVDEWGGCGHARWMGCDKASYGPHNTRDTRIYLQGKKVKFLLNRIIMLGAVPSFCIFLEHLWKVWVENFPKLRHLATNLPSHKAWKKTTKPVSGNHLFISGFNAIVLFQRCTFATSSFCNEEKYGFMVTYQVILFFGR